VHDLVEPSGSVSSAKVLGERVRHLFRRREPGREHVRPLGAKIQDGCLDHRPLPIHARALDRRLSELRDEQNLRAQLQKIIVSDGMQRSDACTHSKKGPPKTHPSRIVRLNPVRRRDQIVWVRQTVRHGVLDRVAVLFCADLLEDQRSLVPLQGFPLPVEINCCEALHKVVGERVLLGRVRRRPKELLFYHQHPDNEPGRPRTSSSLII
jgi:hypothetical protein